MRRENLAWLRARVAAARRAALAGRLAWWGGAFLAAKACTLALGRAGLVEAAGAAAVDLAAFTALFAVVVFPPRKRLADRTLRRLDPDGRLEALREARGRASERLVALEADAHFGELALRPLAAERPSPRAALAFAAGAALFVAAEVWLVASGLGLRLGHAEAIPRSRAGRSETGQVFVEAAEGLDTEAPDPEAPRAGLYPRPDGSAGELDERAALERLRERLARSEAEGAFASGERDDPGPGAGMIERRDEGGGASGTAPGAGSTSPVEAGAGGAEGRQPGATPGTAPDAAGADEGDGGRGSGIGTGEGGRGSAAEGATDAEGSAGRGSSGAAASAATGYEGSGSSLEASPLVDYRARFERLLAARLSGAPGVYAASPFLSPERYADAVARAYGSLRIGIAATADEEPTTLALIAAWAASREAAR